MSEPELPSYVGPATDSPGLFGISFWAVQPSGFDEYDYQRGERLAREALTWAHRFGTHGAIFYPLIEMLKRGNPSHVELGFLNRIAEAARTGSMN